MFVHGVNLITSYYSENLFDKKGINVITDSGDTSFEGISKILSVDDNDPFILFMNKSFDGYSLYMIMNTKDEPFETYINIPCKDNDRLCSINPENLKTEDVCAEIKDACAKIHIKLDAGTPAIICKY